MHLTIFAVAFSTVIVQGFQAPKCPTKTGPRFASEFKELDILSEVENIVPDIAPMDLVQTDDPEIEVSQEEAGEIVADLPEPVLKVGPAGVGTPRDEVTIDMKAQASQQARMIGRLLGMDTGAFPNAPVSGSEAKAIPGMRKVPSIKNYQTDKVIKSFRKVGDQYPEIVKPTDLTKPETHTP